MLELLAAIQSVDPVAWPLVAVFVFSAALYPMGLLMPACMKCGCCKCAYGRPPDTVTITFSGLENSRVYGPPLLPLVFSSDFGTGAEGYVSDPVGVAGPISAVVVTNGGEGYARLGREAPTLTVSGGSGSGGTFTPTLGQSTDADGLPVWFLESVAFSGGTGYLDGDVLEVAHDSAAGDVLVEEPAAAAILYLTRTEPTITLDGNATTTVELEQTENYTWRVSGVTVTAGGSGYDEGDTLTFSADANDTTVSAATGTARVKHEEPANASVSISTAGGSGAVLVPVWELLDESLWPAPNQKTYRLASVTVSNGGSGYADYDLIDITFPGPSDGTVVGSAYLDADTVGATGEILQVYIADPADINTPAAAGQYIGARTDELESVAISIPGEYYEQDPNSYTVLITQPGTYLRENASLPAYVATVDVEIAQPEGDPGTGAALSAVIDDSPGSATFGMITEVSIDNPGAQYLAREEHDGVCCADRNGAVVLTRAPKDPPLVDGEPIDVSDFSCLYYGGWRPSIDRGFPRVSWGHVGLSPFVCADKVYFTYEGRDSLIQIFFMEGTACGQIFTADALVVDCADMTFSASSPSGATATVVPGGGFSDFEALVVSNPCCPNQSLATNPPEEVDAIYEEYGFDAQAQAYIWNPNGQQPANVVGLRDGCGFVWDFAVPDNFAAGTTTKSINIEPLTSSCLEPCGSGCGTFASAPSKYVFQPPAIFTERCDPAGGGLCGPAGAYVLPWAWRNPATGAIWYGEEGNMSNPPAGFTEYERASRLTIQ